MSLGFIKCLGYSTPADQLPGAGWIAPNPLSVLIDSGSYYSPIQLATMPVFGVGIGLVAASSAHLCKGRVTKKVLSTLVIGVVLSILSGYFLSNSMSQACAEYRIKHNLL